MQRLFRVFLTLPCWEEGVPCTAAGGDGEEAVVEPGKAAAAAAAGLYPGTAARGTLPGTIPADTAKLEPGRRVRIS